MELLLVGAMLLLGGYLVIHQVTNTGLFTAKFGSLEMLCLYGPILLALVAPMVRALTGHRNPARPFEIATNLFLAIGSLWLLIAFPFSFAHLADALPGGLRFVLAWFTDDVGKVALVLQVIIGPISALLTARKYLSIRGRERALHPGQQVS
jgi:hypothetical protein